MQKCQVIFVRALIFIDTSPMLPNQDKICLDFDERDKLIIDFRK